MKGTLKKKNAIIPIPPTLIHLRFSLQKTQTTRRSQDIPSYMSLVVLRPSVSVLLSSAISPSAGSVSRVIHTSNPQRKPERQCCSPAGGRISARTLYNVWQYHTQRLFMGGKSHIEFKKKRVQYMHIFIRHQLSAVSQFSQFHSCLLLKTCLIWLWYLSYWQDNYSFRKKGRK